MKIIYVVFILAFLSTTVGSALPNDRERIALPVDMIEDAYSTGQSFVHGGSRYRVVALFNPQNERGEVYCDVYQPGSPASSNMRELAPILDTLIGVILSDLPPVVALEFLGRAIPAAGILLSTR